MEPSLLFEFVSLAVVIVLILVCCTCWRSLERDKNELFHKPNVVNFRKRKQSKSILEVPVEVYTVSVDLKKSEASNDLKKPEPPSINLKKPEPPSIVKKKPQGPMCTMCNKVHH